MAFLLFTGKGSHGSKTYVSFQSTSIRLSKDAVAYIGNPERVKLYWDADANKAAIEPCTNDSDISYRLHKQQIPAAKFLRHIGVMFNQDRTTVVCCELINNRVEFTISIAPRQEE